MKPYYDEFKYGLFEEYYLKADPEDQQVYNLYILFLGGFQISMAIYMIYVIFFDVIPVVFDIFFGTKTKTKRDKFISKLREDHEQRAKEQLNLGKKDKIE